MAPLEAIETGIGIPNTLCWSPDGRRFYFGDTLKNEIRVYDYDTESGDIGPGASFFSGFERGLPDGSAMDSEGFLWNCRYGGGCVVRVAPDGTIDRVIDMPAENITTCTFGGADLTTLYITTAAADRAPEDRLAGSLFAIETGVSGMPENVFRLRLGRPDPDDRRLHVAGFRSGQKPHAHGDRPALAAGQLDHVTLGLFGGVAFDLGGRRKSNAKAVLIRRAADPSHADRRLDRGGSRYSRRCRQDAPEWHGQNRRRRQACRC